MRANYIMLPTQANGAALQLCNYTTGHSVSNVAFCDTPERAQEILHVCRTHADLLEALQALHSNGHLMHFTSDTPEDCAIKSKVLAAIRKALGEEE